jgi:hypothetical protein
MNEHNPSSLPAVGVGALAGAGGLLTHLEPILASLSYIAAIVVAFVTLYFKFRDRNK